MVDIPKFLLYGEGNPKIEESIQPRLEFRQWGDLTASEKTIAFQELENNGWLKTYSDEILETVLHLNREFLRQCPGKNLHKIGPITSGGGYHSNETEVRKAALLDFEKIFLMEKEPMVLRMLSKFLESHIDRYNYRNAIQAKEKKDKLEEVEKAFEKFDRLANCINHIFEQFAVNVVAARSGLVPRQDQKITEQVYVPTLQILADPKWKTVSDDLGGMFLDYQEQNYPEVITKAHRAVQRFLQILVGQEGKNAKGEIDSLFREAEQRKIIPADRFTAPIIRVFQGFLASERATNSTAKPALKNATSTDAMLVMNVVMVFLQHCLQSLD